MPDTFDPSKFVLGTLCHNKHEYGVGGHSLRRLKKRQDRLVPGMCVICQKEDRQRRYRENSEEAKKEAQQWYQDNRERALETRKRYAETHTEEQRAYSREYRSENTAQIKETKSLAYQKHKERIKKASRAWYWGNRDYAKEIRSAWRMKNRDRVRALNRAYSATPAGKEAARRASAKYRMRKATQAGTVTLVYKAAMLVALKGSCPCCGCLMKRTPTLTGSSLTWDHVVPLSRGGQDDDANLLPLCHSCNARKGNRTFEEWYGHPITSIAELGGTPRA